MQFDDLVARSEGAAAFKSIFDGLRSAIAMLRDLRDSPPPNQKEGELINAALDKATRATAIAEAEVANALGFELCKCEFPPIPMLFVGHIDNASAGVRGPVYECPKCGSNSALGWGYTRIAAPRAE
jgi:hypothetical protein